IPVAILMTPFFWPASALPPRNSMNCVKRMTVNGTPETLISSSWITFARKYRLSGERSLPHDREYDVIPDARARSRSKKFFVVRRKKRSIAADGSKDRELARSRPRRRPSAALKTLACYHVDAGICRKV